jgi:ribosomal protein S18 acetylase RimI-like enzyme
VAPVTGAGTEAISRAVSRRLKMADTDKIVYIKAEQSDVDEIFGMYQAAIKHMRMSGIEQWDELYPDKCILLEDIHKNELTVGKREGKIVIAYVVNQEYDEEYTYGNWQYPDSHFCIIHRLCVHPDYQNQGLAQNAVLHIEKEYKEKGFETIRLDSFTKNPYAVTLYKKLDYAIVGHAEWRKGTFDLREKKL